MTSASSSGPWVVQVRGAFGTLLASGLTDGGGELLATLPNLPGLRLDVLGTDAVDVPIQAGKLVEVWLP